MTSNTKNVYVCHCGLFTDADWKLSNHIRSPRRNKSQTHEFVGKATRSEAERYQQHLRDSRRAETAQNGTLRVNGQSVGDGSEVVTQAVIAALRAVGYEPNARPEPEPNTAPTLPTVAGSPKPDFVGNGTQCRAQTKSGNRCSGRGGETGLCASHQKMQGEGKSVTLFSDSPAREAQRRANLDGAKRAVTIGDVNAVLSELSMRLSSLEQVVQALAEGHRDSHELTQTVSKSEDAPMLFDEGLQLNV